ncbi:MAG: saccharopine dehydrogenase NADP-binding domain-containing protein [Candidatus Methanomethylicia archaeon]|nr:saccharopine dehydrogenase NADP-binding domain-containing protein [Candidatus Methanomethylicia archaeon]
MKIAIIGCGPMGRAAAIEIIKEEELEKLCIIDIEEEKLKLVKDELKDNRIEIVKMNVKNRFELEKLVSKYDCVIVALPHKLVVEVDDACINAGVHIVDLAYEPEQLELNVKAIDKNVILVPGCGVAPGLSNILARYGAYKMDRIESVKIRVGGIPIDPKPPLEYGKFFSLESVIDEYTRPVRIIFDGNLMYVTALSGLEQIEIPEVGKLECFYTDGLSTLPYTMKNVKEMWEKTIRWPGHVGKILTLRELGFFDKSEVEVSNVKIKPVDLSLKLLNEKLKEEEDMVILLVDVTGYKGEVYVEAKYKMIDYYDRERKVTSMGRTSGYTCAIIAKMIVKGKISGRGVIPPENLLTKEGIEELLKELYNRRICIEEKVIYNRISW